MDFLRTLLIILLVFFALRFIWSLAKPYLMRYIAKKMGERFEKSFGANPFGDSGPFQQSKRRENDGKVTIDRDTPNRSASSKKVGEYVDFEEID
ncbi:MAG: DUF4834 family protein [Marinirhabdus sp.]|nr:DUF4834 family protein [Marinirhabdus sp.]